MTIAGSSGFKGRKEQVELMIDAARRTSRRGNLAKKRPNELNKTPADQRDIFRPKSFEQQNRFKSKNLYKYISQGTKFMSVEFCEFTFSYYVNNNSWQIL